jgi:hypothetical protein
MFNRDYHHANDVTTQEKIRAGLTDAAAGVATCLGVKGVSVDQKSELWEALGRVLHKPTHAASHGQALMEDSTRQETLIAEATDAAYSVVLGWGFPGSFLDMELGLWRGLCRVIAKNTLPNSSRSI